MPTRVNEWFKPPPPQDRIIDLLEGLTSVAMELLIAVGLVLFVVGTSFLFVASTIYLNSPVAPRGPSRPRAVL